MLQLIFSLLILSGMAAFLALLLELAAAYLADYGEVRIRVNKQEDLTVQGGSPLLFSLMEHRIFVPSACGGRGTCALCKVRVLEGGGPVLPTETPYLGPEEIQNHVRLSCQVKVRNDLAISIPEELFNIKEFRVRETTLFFGEKTRADLLYYDVLKGFERTIPNFTFVPTLSRISAGEEWDGERGRVTNLIEKRVPGGARIDVYICGSPTMVESCETLLKKKGIPADRIFFDKFG